MSSWLRPPEPGAKRGALHFIENIRKWPSWPLFFMADERLAETLTRLEDLIEPVISGEGFELVQMTYKPASKGFLLRLMIDRPGRENYAPPTTSEERIAQGVTIDDCAIVSRAVGPALEVEDVIPGAYTLEVSSPGVNRPLVKPQHFKLAVGMMIRIKTRVPIEGESFFIAELTAAEESHIVLDVRGEDVEVPYRLVSKANLEMEF